MKTVEEFIIEINRSAELQNAIKAIKDRDALADFLKKNDVGGTVDDFESAVKERANAEGALSDDEAGSVAGGAYWWFP